MTVENLSRSLSDHLMKVAFIVLMLLLGTALFRSLLAGYVFWSLITAWMMLIAMAPEFRSAILSQGRPLAATMAVAGLFVLYLFLGPAHASITDVGSMLWSIPGNMVVFVVVLITFLVVNERGHGHMVRQFLMVVTLVSYMALILLQGPLDHYIGLLLGMDLVPGNAQFMRYYIFSTATGIVLSFAMVNYMRRRSGSMINPGGVDWE